MEDGKWVDAPFPPQIENPQLTLKRTGMSEANDVVVRNGYLYGISSLESGSFFVCDIRGERADAPQKIAEITGLGNMRQIEISDSAVPGRRIAAVTARECGLYLLDVTAPEHPEVVCHYNSVEFATGVAFYDRYVFIGCRSFGVEIIEISDPACPKHCSVISAGEVQSLFVADGILYTGSWGERQVNLIDVHDVTAPKKLATIPLEGRGDGLTVQNGILYAAFGQHLRPATGLDPNEYGYARGNGFAIWDVSNPAEPKQLSVTFFPYRYFCTYWDMWDVALCGTYAVVSHTFNGVWIYDISDLTAPKLVDHTAIASEYPAEEMVTFNEITTKIRPTIFPFPFDRETIPYAPVCGVAAAEGRLYVASRFAKLHVAHGPYFVEEVEPEGTLSEPSCDFYAVNPGKNCEGVLFARTPGQAHAAIFANGVVWVACGMDGIRVYSPDDLTLLAQIPMRDLFDGDAFAMDIRERNGLFVIAAGAAGVLFCRAEGYRLVCIGRCDFGGKTCAQVVPSENGRFIMVHSDDHTLVILNCADPTHAYPVMQEHYEPGAIYHRQLSYEGVQGRYYGCFWNANQTHWYDLSGEEPILTEWINGRLSVGTGIIGLNEPYLALAVHNKGYYIHDIRESFDYEDRTMKHPEGVQFRGKPIFDGQTLCATDRMRGVVVLCDLRDRENPKLIRRMEVTGHPDIGCFVPGGVVVPLGHQGIARVATQSHSEMI